MAGSRGLYQAVSGAALPFPRLGVHTWACVSGATLFLSWFFSSLLSVDAMPLVLSLVLDAGEQGQWGPAGWSLTACLHGSSEGGVARPPGKDRYQGQRACVLQCRAARHLVGLQLIEGPAFISGCWLSLRFVNKLFYFFRIHFPGLNFKKTTLSLILLVKDMMSIHWPVKNSVLLFLW